MVHSGTLPKPSYQERCDVPVTVIPVGNQTWNYLLFTAVDHYYRGPALEYIGVNYAEDEGNSGLIHYVNLKISWLT